MIKKWRWKTQEPIIIVLHLLVDLQKVLPQKISAKNCIGQYIYERYHNTSYKRYHRLKAPTQLQKVNQGQIGAVILSFGRKVVFKGWPATMGLI